MIVLRKIQKKQPNVVIGGELKGILNGSNMVFKTDNKFNSSKITVYYNGQALHSPDDFLITDSNEITLKYMIPNTDTELKATYELED